MAIKKRNLVIMNLVGFVIGLLLVGVTFIIDQSHLKTLSLMIGLGLVGGMALVYFTGMLRNPDN